MSCTRDASPSPARRSKSSVSPVTKRRGRFWRRQRRIDTKQCSAAIAVHLRYCVRMDSSSLDAEWKIGSYDAAIVASSLLATGQRIRAAPGGTPPPYRTIDQARAAARLFSLARRTDWPAYFALGLRRPLALGLVAAGAHPAVLRPPFLP